MGARKLQKDHYLFREGDPPDAMYVLKSGRLAVVKTKSNSEVLLAELNPGAMVGEMAFFDNKPRSASVKAVKDSEVIALPYKALHAQFSTFPEWCKAIMRTVNDHLRNANQRIKQLEKSDAEGGGDLFPPHTINKLISILNLIGTKFGKLNETTKLMEINGQTLRDYTIQIFQEPTHKMQKLTNVLMDLELVKVEELGEGKSKVIILKPDLLYSFVYWYNEWLFKQEKDRITIKEEELKILTALIHFAKKQQPDDKGITKINLTEMQNDSMRELGYLIKTEDTMPLVEKKVIGDHVMSDDGKSLFTSFKLDEIEKTTPYWKIIYTLTKVRR